MADSDATAHPEPVSSHDRERFLGQRGCVVWLTGLSGAGKSTIAHAVERALFARGNYPVVLDGDHLRKGLNSDLGFSASERSENLRRTGAVAALFADAAIVVLCALISPFRADRERIRATVGADRFLEIFIDTPIDVCERRDPKGLYQRARRGEIAEFTGISSPYEPPDQPALIIRTDTISAETAADQIMRLLQTRAFITMEIR
jgi:adenylyl-sulfate kinase